MAVGFDPLRTRWRWQWQRQIANRNPLLLVTMDAEGNNLLQLSQLDARHLDIHTQNDRGKRNVQVILDHREEAADGLLFVVAIHGRFRDERNEPSLAQRGPLRSLEPFRHWPFPRPA
jgi:hypothetical protein